MFTNLTVNETIFNGTANGTVSELIGNLPNKGFPAGCNPTIDRIVQEGASIICYHQYTVQEVLEKLIPAFVIFGIAAWYTSYKIMLPRLKKSERVQKFIAARSIKQTGKG